ncbi:MAG: S-layer homology domain-containing protein, partial [Oscillospiraceae bacterium]|nr:S-layer homology domain-containing protein [Oscillospiraceae bacterium]
FPHKGTVYTIEITGRDAVLVSLPISALPEDVSLLVVKTDAGSVTLTKEMLEAYMAAHGDTLTVSLKAGSLTVDLLKSGNSVNYNDPDNPLLITIPVTPAADTTTNGYVGVMKTASGSAIMPYSIYKDGAVVFQTSSTGTFDVIYNAKAFPDVAGHWAIGYINFVGARDLYAGNEKGEFMPGGTMTRSGFARVLANLEQADLSVYKTTRFTDVAASAWYAPAVEWAADMDIVTGLGDNRFNPDAYITREEMARMLANYIRYKGYSLPSGSAPELADEASIASWALSAVKQIQAAGIITGRPGSLYEPKDTASRADVATIFARFIEAYVNGIAES